MNKIEYDNIFNLTIQTLFHKLIVIRDSWNDGNYLIVNKVILNSYNKYGVAYGEYHYKNGNVIIGKIECAGCYSWKILKVLKEEMEVK